MLPQLENALLAGHDVIFLGERGQAKTRMIRSLTGLLDEWMPIVAGSEINDDPYDPVSRHARDLVAEHGDDTPIEWVHRDDALRREAGHARHVDRRPHRRGRPDQGRRGPLPLRRADAALRPRAPHQPRHLRHQRAARPRRAHPGRPAQRARGARRADPRLQDPPAARRHAGRLGQPGGLHQPRPHHHAAEGPLRRARSARTTRSTSRPRWRSCARRPRPLDVGGLRVQRARLHGRDRRHASASWPAAARTSTSARGVSVRLVGRQPRDAGRQRRSPRAAARRERRRAAGQRPRRAGRRRPPARSRSRRWRRAATARSSSAW